MAFNGMSQIMHEFVRECIVRGKWKHKVRPVSLNSWEARYFDINESRLLKLAKAGKDVGVELLSWMMAGLGLEMMTNSHLETGM